MESGTFFLDAADFTIVGLEDFRSKRQRRPVSATRNIFAGIFLVFEHGGARRSPHNARGSSSGSGGANSDSSLAWRCR